MKVIPGEFFPVLSVKKVQTCGKTLNQPVETTSGYCGDSAQKR
jgi:hypothetical protein